MDDLVAIWVTFLLVGQVGFLLGFRWLERLPDGGYASGRILGWVLWSVLTGACWASGACLLTRTLTACTLTALVLVAGFAAWRQRTRLAGFVRERLALIVSFEAVFAAAFAGAAFLVSHHGDIHPRAMERFQDFSLLQAIATSRVFPVEDPWFAGEPLVYYFFGHFMVAQVELLLDADPWRFFNPAVALVQALMALGAFGLGFDLTRRRVHGLSCLFLIGACGTLWPLVTTAAWTTQWRPVDWFGPCRAIPGTITEFPAFNVLCADLHAHVIGFPLFLFSCTLVLLFLLRSGDIALPARPGYASLDQGATSEGAVDCARAVPVRLRSLAADLLPSVILGALVAGVELATNSLDGFAAAALWGLALVAFLARNGADRARWAFAGAALALIVGGGVLVSWPFTRQLFGQGRAVLWVTERSGLVPFVTHFGIPLTLLGIGAASWLGRRDREEPDGPTCFGLAATLLALFLLAACEVVYVHATHGPTDQGRAVTTSKLYLQAWILMGAANCVLLSRMGPGRFTRWTRPVVLLLLALGLVYPLLGSMARTSFFHPGRALWAGATVRRSEPAVWAAVHWLRSRGPGRPVIMEATGSSYTWQSRLGTLTGGVSVLGWREHQGGWRNSWSVITERTRLVDLAYRGRLERALLEESLDRLRVEYVAVGALEREKYPAAGLQALVEPYAKVFESQGLALYRRPRSNGPTAKEGGR